VQYNNTGEFLAVHYEHLDKEWLTKVNKSVGEFKQNNDEEFEMHVRWHKGRVKWTDWIKRVFNNN
jgi:hypothetical protein